MLIEVHGRVELIDIQFDAGLTRRNLLTHMIYDGLKKFLADSHTLGFRHDIYLMKMEYFSPILVGAFVLNRDIAARNGENTGPGFTSSRSTIVTAGYIIRVEPLAALDL